MTDRDAELETGGQTRAEIMEGIVTADTFDEALARGRAAGYGGDALALGVAFALDYLARDTQGDPVAELGHAVGGFRAELEAYYREMDAHWVKEYYRKSGGTL